MKEFEYAKKFRSGEFQKPVAKVIGKDGNVFNILGITQQSIEREYSLGSVEIRKSISGEIFDRVTSATSYGMALSIMQEYVKFV